MKEPILEPILRNIRISQVLPEIKKYENCNVLDIGCGWEAKFLISIEKFIASGIGIDFKAPDMNNDKITTLEVKLQRKLPFENESFDVVTMLAVLEHLDYPCEIIQEIERVLRPNGKLIITVPSIYSKPVLEFLSYKLKIVNEEEIRDHKKYYNKSSLRKLFLETGLEIESHKYFQLCMNNFCIARKAAPKSPS